MEEKNEKRRKSYRLNYENNPRLGWVFKILRNKGIGIDEITKKDETGHSITGHSPMYYYHCLNKDNMTLKEIDDLLALLGIKTEYKLIDSDSSSQSAEQSLGNVARIAKYNHVYNEESDEYVKQRTAFIDEALAKRNITKTELAKDINRTRQTLHHIWSKDKMNMLVLASICETEGWDLIIKLNDEEGNKQEIKMKLATTDEEKFTLKKRSVISRKKRENTLENDKKYNENPSEM